MFQDVWLKYKELSPWAGATQWNDTGKLKKSDSRNTEKNTTWTDDKIVWISTGLWKTVEE